MYNLPAFQMIEIYNNRKMYENKSIKKLVWGEGVELKTIVFPDQRTNHSATKARVAFLTTADN